LKANTIEEAYEKYADCTVDDTSILEHQERQ